MRTQALRCCVCIGLADKERPEGYLGLELTIVNGFLVCTEHGPFAGPNTPWAAWRNSERAHGREPS